MMSCAGIGPTRGPRESEIWALVAVLVGERSYPPKPMEPQSGRVKVVVVMLVVRCGGAGKGKERKGMERKGMVKVECQWRWDTHRRYMYRYLHLPYGSRLFYLPPSGWIHFMSVTPLDVAAIAMSSISFCETSRISVACKHNSQT